MTRDDHGPEVRLRGHHLLCILTFAGRGYSPAFVDAMAEIVDRLAAGEPVEIVDGPDDICAAHVLESADPHCLLARPFHRDALALADVGRVFGLDLRAGYCFTPPPGWLAAMQRAFAAGTIRSACAGCPWDAFCSEIAEADYAAARLSMPVAGQDERSKT